MASARRVARTASVTGRGPLHLHGEPAPLRAHGEPGPSACAGEPAPLRAPGQAAPLRAQGERAPLRAQGERAPLRAQGEPAPLRAPGQAAPLRRAWRGGPSACARTSGPSACAGRARAPLRAPGRAAPSACACVSGAFCKISAQGHSAVLIVRTPEGRALPPGDMGQRQPLRLTGALALLGLLLWAVPGSGGRPHPRLPLAILRSPLALSLSRIRLAHAFPSPSRQSVHPIGSALSRDQAGARLPACPRQSVPRPLALRSDEARLAPARSRLPLVSLSTPWLRRSHGARLAPRLRACPSSVCAPLGSGLSRDQAGAPPSRLPLGSLCTPLCACPSVLNPQLCVAMLFRGHPVLVTPGRPGTVHAQDHAA